MQSGNPALSGDVFRPYQSSYTGPRDLVDEVEAMTVEGTAVKTGILLSLAVLTAGFTWNQLLVGGQAAMPWMMGGLIGGLIFAVATIFKPNWSPITAPAYALFEGVFLGGISAMYSAMYEGIVVQAVALTFGTMVTMLVVYGTGLVRVTEKFRAGVAAATFGVLLVYGISLLMNLFGAPVPYIHESGIVGIGFSLVVVGIAALNLVLDFDFIERAAEAQAPKAMEWYGAFGLMVTLVWLYLEILRLLSKLSSRE